jgi:hypothetical protein
VSTLFPVFFVLFLALVVAIIFVQYSLKKKRRQEMRALARELGAKYHAEDPYRLTRYGPYFDPLDEGSNRYAFNVIRNDELTLFDHHHETSDGKHTHTHERTFVLFRQDTDLGRVRVVPEHFGHAVASLFGIDDIDFESAEFSKRYHVTSDDRKLAYGLFDAGMIEHFLSLRDIELWINRHLVLASRRDRLLEPAEIGRLVRDVRGIVRRIPRYLRKDRSAR